jgi:hypothetical protein
MGWPVISTAYEKSSMYLGCHFLPIRVQEVFSYPLLQRGVTPIPCIYQLSKSGLCDGEYCRGRTSAGHSLLGHTTIQEVREKPRIPYINNGGIRMKPQIIRFFEAAVGTDLSFIIPRFMVWLMGDLQQAASKYAYVIHALDTVKELYQRVIDGDTVTGSEWDAAKDAAWKAAKRAWVTVPPAPEAAPRAAMATAYAVRAMEDGMSAALAADSASRAMGWESDDKMTDKLLELL